MATAVAPWGATGVLTTAVTPLLGVINTYNVSTGGFTVTLPPLSSISPIGARVMIEKDPLDASGNAITVQRSGADTFLDGSTSFTVTTARQQEQAQLVLVGGVRYWKRLTGGSGAGGGITANSIDTLANKTLTAPKFVDGGFIADNNGNEQIVFHTTALAANQIEVTNAPAGSGPIIAAAGGDTNINTYINGKGTGRVYASGDQVVTATLPQVITNKIFPPRVLSDTNVASWTINSGLYDFAENNGLTTGVTINNPTGAPTNYQPLVTELTGTAARAITYGSQFVDGPGGTRPTTTTTTQRLTLAWRWSSATSQWRLWAQGSA